MTVDPLNDILEGLKPERLQPPREPLDDETIREELAKLGNWKPAAILSEREFDSFHAAAEFFVGVANLAIAFDHTPRMVIDGRKVQITLTTPGVGLTAADFVLAQGIDQLAP